MPAAARQKAPQLYKALQLGAQLVAQKQSTAAVKAQVMSLLSTEAAIQLEYFEVIDAQTLQPVEGVVMGQEVALCIAAWLADVRLIDNIVL